ncbi:unnamed protein product [Clonostachys byssicola]|uniref:Extradiol ring-cleavage dioxygenase class III enzyme subunit B domain-containing protein n=1 Tax=Clonostachys byssicola TaxID=160290 RepID=A0A9N9Y9X4_9HYPO|nr:unnamed protein product [Clonostachys byssicola]
MAFSENNSKNDSKELRAPSLFISHGAGPMPLLNPDHESYRQLLRGHGQLLDGVKAVILVSAHWETDEPHITSASDPGLFYDYEDMRDILPREAFEFKYSAKGEALAGFRERGYAICGSGGSYHDFHAVAKAVFENQPIPPSASAFEKFLESSATVSDAAERRNLLLGWRDLPESFIAHKEGESDHFMPFLVAAASGGDQSGEQYDMYNYKGAPMSFYKW